MCGQRGVRSILYYWRVAAGGGGGGGVVWCGGCRASLADRDRNLYRCHPQLTASSPQHWSFSVVPGCSP